MTWADTRYRSIISVQEILSTNPLISPHGPELHFICSEHYWGGALTMWDRFELACKMSWAWVGWEQKVSNPVNISILCVCAEEMVVSLWLLPILNLETQCEPLISTLCRLGTIIGAQQRPAGQSAHSQPVAPVYYQWLSLIAPLSYLALIPVLIFTNFN